LSTILVPLDGSPLAEQALPVAERLAQAVSGRLVLVRAVQVFTFPGVDARDAQVAASAEAQEYLESHASRLTASGLAVEIAVPYGEAATEILDEISIRNADLIVMATHGRAGVGRWLYGSVADEILRRAPLPVMLVPPGSAHALPGDRPPHILVPLDGSEVAEAALTPASELAVRLGAEVVLLRVVSLPTYGVYAVAGEYPPFDQNAEMMDAQRYVANVAGRLRPVVGHVRVRAEVAYPAPFIAQAAREEGADLICMATHGRGGVARLVLGSVTTDVLRRTNVPLLVVRPVAPWEPTRPAAAAPEASAEIAPTPRVIQAPLSIGELRLLQRGLGELLYKPGGDPDLAPRVRELRDRLARIERAAVADTTAAQL
jgi:nucleotide-binding universal stress UspA family protein